MRRLLVTLLVLALLLVVADRVAVQVVQRAVADRMREDGRLGVTPTVQVRGFPFLTQALRGRYDRVDIHIRDLERSGLTVGRLDVTVRGAQLPLSKVRSAHDVPVESLHASAVITYLELAHESGLAGITVAPDGDGVRVTGAVAGVRASATSTVALRGERIVVTAQRLGAGGLSVPTGGVLDFSVRVPPLPYGLHLDSARAYPDGVHLLASSGVTVLTPR